jgi:hypothetical protein
MGNKNPEPHETGRQRGHSDWPIEKRTHPAKEKTPERAEPPAKVDVGAAGLRKSRTEFGIAEGAQKHDEQAEDPGDQHQ